MYRICAPDEIKVPADGLSHLCAKTICQANIDTYGPLRLEGRLSFSARLTRSNDNHAAAKDCHPASRRIVLSAHQVLHTFADVVRYSFYILRPSLLRSARARQALSHNIFDRPHQDALPLDTDI